MANKMNIRELTNLDHISGFRGEYAQFMTREENGHLEIGLVNRQGKIVWNAHSVLPVTHVCGNVFLGRPKDRESLLFYDIVQQKEVERPLLRHNFDGGYFLLNAEGKWALFVDDKQVTGYIYDGCVAMLENFVPTMPGKNLVVTQDHKSFYIDKTGQCISKQYDYLEPCTRSGYALAKIGGRIWVISADEKPLCATQWDDVWFKTEEDSCYERYCIGLRWIIPDWLQLTEDNKWSIIDPYNNLILPAQYDDIRAFNDFNAFLIKENGLWGMMSKEQIVKGTFRWTLPCIYQSLNAYSEYYVARKNGKVGVINEQGEVIIPFEYDSFAPARDEKLNLISVKKDGECYFINAQQERIDLF